jgi:hypothetical protein
MPLAFFLLLAAALSACSGATSHGACVGLDESDRDPTLEYRISVRNAFWSFMGFEMVLPPILWLTSYAYCPVGKKVTP